MVYQGQYAEIDPETGWNNFDLRMYDSVLGRWMSTDPYREHWSPSLAMGNAPLDTVDPDGGCEKCPKNIDGSYQLDEVNIIGKRTGFYKDFFQYSVYAKDSPKNNSAYFYMQTAGYEYHDKNYDFKSNWTTVGLRGTNYTGSGKLPLAPISLDGEGAVTDVGLSGRYGTKRTAVMASARGRVLYAKGKANIGILTGEGNKVGVAAEAGGGVGVLHGEITYGINIFGIAISVNPSWSFVSAEAYSGSAYYINTTGVTTIKGDVRAAWGLGGGMGFKISYR